MFRRLLLALFSLPLLTAASPVVIFELNNNLLPPAISPDPAVLKSVRSGDVLLQQGLVMRPLLELSEPLTLDHAGMKVNLPAGTKLIDVVLQGGETDKDRGRNRTACARITKSQSQATVDGAVSFVQRFEPSAVNSDPRNDRHFCMIDSNGDDKLDQFLPIFAKTKDEKLLQSMRPVAMSITPGAAYTYPREVVIVFNGTGGLGSALTFYAAIKVKDKLTSLEQFPVRVRQSKLPHTLELLGASFVVESYEPATGVAKVRIERSMLPFQLIRLNSPFIYSL